MERLKGFGLAERKRQCGRNSLYFEDHFLNMLEQSRVMEYSDYQLRFIERFDRNPRLVHSRRLFEEIEELVEDLDLDEPIHPTITEIWNKSKERGRSLYHGNEFEKIDERLQQSKKIDESVFQLDFGDYQLFTTNT